MRALYAFITLGALVITACGGTPAAVTPSQQPSAQIATATVVPTTTAQPTAPTTVGGQTATPQSTPTQQQTATPRPTQRPPSLLVEVTNDADVTANIVCKSPAEVSKMNEAMTYENYKFPLPFDPRGKKFTVSRFSVKHQDGDMYTIFAVKFTDGTATVMSFLPFLQLVARQGSATDLRTLPWVIIPQNENRPMSTSVGTVYLDGGKGVYVDISADAEVVIPREVAPLFREVGKPLLKVGASSKPLSKWNNNGQIVFYGRASNTQDNASPIGPDAILKEGNKMVALCAA